MSEAIFYKSNNDELCRCELESNQEIVSQRKKDFEEYLNRRDTPNKYKKTSYKNQTYKFFFNLSHLELLTPTITNEINDFIYQISDITALTKIKNAMSKKDGDTTYQNLNDDHQKTNGSANACLGIYIEFLEQEKREIKYTLRQEEKRKLLEIINNLKEEIDKSFRTNKKTFPWSSYRGEIDNILGRLNLATDINIGQGNLSSFCSIAFCRTDLDRQKYPIKVGQGFYIWLGYFPTTQSFEMHFGNGDTWNKNLRHTKALKKLKSDNALSLDYHYKDFNELENKFIEDFFTLVEYFNKPIADDFCNFSNLKMIFDDFRKTLYPKTELDSFDKDIHHFDKMEKLFQNSDFAKKYSHCKQQYQNPKSGYFYIYGNSRGISYTMKNEQEEKRNPESLSFELFEKYMTTGKVSHYESQAIPTFNTILKWSERSNDQGSRMTNNTPLNQILYGSPATGKTYSTIDKALEILEFDIQTMTRQKKKELFEEYREKGQIEFVTFHQSYGYEEFVEGIKPLTDDKKNVYYEVTSGIFKTLCHRARKNLEDSQKTKEVLQKEVDISNAISDFFNESISEGTSFSKTQGGKFTLKEIQNEKVYIQTEDTDTNLNFSISDFEKIVLSNKDFKSSRELALEVFEEKNQSQIRTYMFQLYKEFRKGNFNQSQSQIVEEVKRQNYILIIDEINRGNISKIFGELITLIEPSKRIGEKEELRVTLPYSQESFGVPSNLYIIGTMNTADRSITSLDTALRRRFEFVEMMPNPSELQNIKVYKDNQETEIELQAMLEKINKRIEFLYDREKTIGHAFFLKDEEQASLDIQELKNIFQNKIIPLLQEYFYNDYAQIYAVLNCNAMIEKNEEKIRDLFAMDKLSGELDLEDKTIYTIARKDDELWENPQTYIDIYKKS